MPNKFIYAVLVGVAASGAVLAGQPAPGMIPNQSPVVQPVAPVGNAVPSPQTLAPQMGQPAPAPVASPIPASPFPFPAWGRDKAYSRDLSSLIRQSSLMEQRLQLQKKRNELREALRVAQPNSSFYVDSIGSFNGKSQADLAMSDGRMITVSVGDVVENGYRVIRIGKANVTLRRGRSTMTVGMAKPSLTSVGAQSGSAAPAATPFNGSPAAPAFR